MKKNLHPKLKKYLSGAAAAIASVSAAHASIVYTDIPDQLLNVGGSSFDIDLDNNAVNDFRITFDQSSYYSSVGIQELVAGNYYIASTGGNYALALSSGIGIGASVPSAYWGTDPGTGYRDNIGFYAVNSSASYGAWNGGTTAYVGVRFLNGVDTHYGWIQLNVANAYSSVTIMDYAYESCADSTIGTGFTSGGATCGACSPTSSTQSVTDCDAVVINGNTYTSSQTVVDTLVGANAAGCDSIVTTNLTINYSTSGSESVTECDSYTWPTSGATYTSTGAYTATLMNAAGCDSTATLNLTINNSTSGSESVTECGSYTWPTSGATYTSTGAYTATLTNAAGCDSTATLNLTINNATSGSETRVACGSYTWNSVTYNSTGAYTTTLTNAAGCDSTATLNLTIDTYAQANINVSGCSSVSVFGNTYTSSQVVNDTLIGGSANGCDSITVANITVKLPTSGSESVTECDSYTWSANGATYTSTGAYTATLTNAAGCDSTATLNLTINNATAGSESVTECDSYTWPTSGATYTSTGAYTATLTNAAGCDSTATLNLTINNATSGSESVIACNSYTWSANGTTYTSSGAHTATLTNAAGCDSTATLNLTISTFSQSNITLSGCDSVVAFGNTYTSNQTVNDTLVGGSSQGCDSITVATIVVNPSYAVTTDTTINMGDSIFFNGNFETTSGTYTANLMTAANCDSLLTLNLTVTDTTGGPGSIAELNNSIRVYPNPTKGLLIFESKSMLKQVRIIDMKGSTLINEKVNLMNGNIDMTALHAGIYFYELIDENNQIVRGKIIKE